VQLNINENIIHSPTFVFLNEIRRRNLYFSHIDLYRIEDKFVHEIVSDHVEDISTIRNKKAVTAIEWADKLSEVRKRYGRAYKDTFQSIYIKIEINKNNKRKLTVYR